MSSMESGCRRNYITVDGIDCSCDLANGASMGLGGLRILRGADVGNLAMRRCSDDSRLSICGRRDDSAPSVGRGLDRLDSLGDGIRKEVERANGARIGEGGRNPV